MSGRTVRRREHREYLSVLAALVSLSCASPVTKLASTPPDERGVERRQFRIECIALEQCKEKATAACGSQYQVVSEWHNTIPESELPGLNEQSRPKDVREWNAPTLPRATGIESSEPMPLSSIVVACTA
jgi:hypothetical protein